MNNNKENLEGLVSRLREHGIHAGEEEKQRIIDDARSQAEQILAEAEKKSRNMIERARARTELMEDNAGAAMAQASRDMVEATKTAILLQLKSVFGEQCLSLFTTREYMGKLLEVVLETIPGNKTVRVPEHMRMDMESYILQQATQEDIVIKPLAESQAKIVVTSVQNKGLHFVLSEKDVEEGLFSLLNKDLVERITRNKDA